MYNIVCAYAYTHRKTQKERERETCAHVQNTSIRVNAFIPMYVYMYIHMCTHTYTYIVAYMQTYIRTQMMHKMSGCSAFLRTWARWARTSANLCLQASTPRPSTLQASQVSKLFLCGCMHVKPYEMLMLCHMDVTNICSRASFKVMNTWSK